MSSTNPAPAQMTVPSWLSLPLAARYVAEIAAHAIAADLTSPLEALAEARTAAVFSQFACNRPRMGA